MWPVSSSNKTNQNARGTGIVMLKLERWGTPLVCRTLNSGQKSLGDPHKTHGTERFMSILSGSALPVWRKGKERTASKCELLRRVERVAYIDRSSYGGEASGRPQDDEREVGVRYTP